MGNCFLGCKSFDKKFSHVCNSEPLAGAKFKTNRSLIFVPKSSYWCP